MRNRNQDETVGSSLHRGRGFRAMLPRRVALAATSLAAASAGVLGLATAASAHANSVKGAVACIANTETANYSITWTISNDYNENETANITSTTLGSTTLNLNTLSATQVAINASPSTSNESTGVVTQTLPGTDAGTVTLNLYGFWSQPGQQNFTSGNESGTVSLPGTCVPTTTTTTTTTTVPKTITTTTTTTVPPTTTVPKTTTTIPAATTTTIPAATTTTIPAATTTSAGNTISVKASSSKKHVKKLIATKAQKAAIAPVKASVTG